MSGNRDLETEPKFIILSSETFGNGLPSCFEQRLGHMFALGASLNNGSLAVSISCQQAVDRQ